MRVDKESGLFIPGLDPRENNLALYIMGGYFMNLDIGELQSFSGRFQMDSHGDLEGILDDYNGRSVISGNMDEARLRFDKYYIEHNLLPPIRYEYSASPNGWRGTYIYRLFDRSIRTRATNCVTALTPNTELNVSIDLHGDRPSRLLSRKFETWSTNKELAPLL